MKIIYLYSGLAFWYIYIYLSEALGLLCSSAAIRDEFLLSKSDVRPTSKLCRQFQQHFY